MHSCIFNPRFTRHSDGLHHLILRLRAWPYLGLVGEAAPSPLSLHLLSGAAGLYPLGLFCFTRCISNTLAFRRILEDSALFLRVTLSIFDVRRFPEEAPELPAKFLSLSLPRELVSFFSSAWSTNNLGSLWYCRRVDIFLFSHMSGFFGFLLVPKVSLFSWGSEILGGTALRLRAMSWEFFSLAYCFVIQWQISFPGLSYLLSRGLTLVAGFPLHSLEEERIK